MACTTPERLLLVAVCLAVCGALTAQEPRLYLAGEGGTDLRLAISPLPGARLHNLYRGMLEQAFPSSRGSWKRRGASTTS